MLAGRNADVGLARLRKIEDHRIMYALIPALEREGLIGPEPRNDVKLGGLDAGLLLRLPERRG